MLFLAADRWKLPLPASVHSTGSRPELQFLVPANKHSVTITGPTVTVEEPTPETGHSSDHSSSAADDGEVSDLDSTGQDQEELLEGDQELSAEQSYRETLRGVRSFMAWNDIPEFDYASSSHLPVADLLRPVKCRSKSLSTNGSARNLKSSTSPCRKAIRHVTQKLLDSVKTSSSSHP